MATIDTQGNCILSDVSTNDYKYHLEMEMEMIDSDSGNISSFGVLKSIILFR